MVIIVTLALALLFEQILLLKFGQYGISLTPFLGGYVNIYGVKVTKVRILSLFVALSVLLMLEIFMSKTKIGKMIFAVSEDSEAATLLGINVDLIYAIVMFFSGILAGIAGIFYAQIFAISPQESLRALIYTFAIVILGGLGSLRGGKCHVLDNHRKVLHRNNPHACIHLSHDLHRQQQVRCDLLPTLSQGASTGSLLGVP